jgi:hypothetical protein
MVVKIIGERGIRGKKKEEGEERTNPYKNYASSPQNV